MDGVGTDGSLLCFSGMTSHHSSYGESFLQMLVQNKATTSAWGDHWSCWCCYINVVLPLTLYMHFKQSAHSVLLLIFQ